jgi:hypothetical protein
MMNATVPPRICDSLGDDALSSHKTCQTAVGLGIEGRLKKKLISLLSQ